MALTQVLVVFDGLVDGEDDFGLRSGEKVGPPLTQEERLADWLKRLRELPVFSRFAVTIVESSAMEQLCARLELPVCPEAALLVFQAQLRHIGARVMIQG